MNKRWLLLIISIFVILVYQFYHWNVSQVAHKFFKSGVQLKQPRLIKRNFKNEIIHVDEPVTLQTILLTNGSSKPSIDLSSNLSVDPSTASPLNAALNFKNDSLIYNEKGNTSMYFNEASKLMKFDEISCDPIFPEVLLYNRIFKTGSTTINTYILSVTNNTNITVKSGTTEDWYKRGDPSPYPDHIQKYAAKRERLVYNAHFFFRGKLNISRPYTYINIFREPVQRVVSHYHYMRNEKLRAKHRIRELKKSGQWNETLIECVHGQHRGCEDNVMTRFICGTPSYCKTGSRKALDRAKLNLKRFYSCVGTLKNIGYFIKVLRKRLPSFFVQPYMELVRQKQNSKKDRSVDKDVLQIIRNRNKADIELYKLASALEKEQIRACAL